MSETLQSCFTFAPINSLYIDYHLWNLGQARNIPVGVLMTGYKVGKLSAQILLFKMIIETIIEYFTCPKKPGFSWTGYQPWSSDYSQICFDKLVSLFNILPGQPANTLIDVIPQYYFPDGTYNLDLSYKGLDPLVIIEILEGFKKTGPTLVGLNLAGNILTNSLDGVKLWNAIPTTLVSLNLSKISVSINFDMTITTSKNIFVPNIQAMGFKIGQLRSLMKLDLSNNYLGAYIGKYAVLNLNGMIAIGQGLGQLHALTSLDLSGNQLGLYDAINPDGTIAIGQGIGQLHSLTSLKLSGRKNALVGDSWIGYYDSLNATGTIAIGQGLGQLHSLTSLDLSGNYVGKDNQDGVVSTSQPKLPQVVI
jgi:hypothetical protein